MTDEDRKNRQISYKRCLLEMVPWKIIYLILYILIGVLMPLLITGPLSDFIDSIQSVVLPLLEPALVPGYSEELIITVSTRLLQVAVLYFAVLVAAFRLLDGSEQLGLGSNLRLSKSVIAAQILVALSAVVSSLVVLIPTNFGLLVAVAPMTLAFVFSVVAPIVGAGEVSLGKETTEPQVSHKQFPLVGTRLVGVKADSDTDTVDSETDSEGQS